MIGPGCFRRLEQLWELFTTKAARADLSFEAGALGDFQRLGRFVNGALPLHSFHDAEPCGGISADKMLQAFFSMSR
jgi:hypothetical protein